jgi:hypothetical protein
MWLSYACALTCPLSIAACGGDDSANARPATRSAQGDGTSKNPATAAAAEKKTAVAEHAIPSSSSSAPERENAGPGIPPASNAAHQMKECSDVVARWAVTAAEKDQPIEGGDVPAKVASCVETLVKTSVTPTIARARDDLGLQSFLFALRWIKPLTVSETPDRPVLAVSYRAAKAAKPHGGWSPLSMLVYNDHYIVVADDWLISHPSDDDPWTTEQWFCPKPTAAEPYFGHAFESKGEKDIGGVHLFDAAKRKIVYKADTPTCGKDEKRPPDVTREPPPFPELDEE